MRAWDDDNIDMVASQLMHVTIAAQSEEERGAAQDRRPLDSVVCAADNSLRMRFILRILCERLGYAPSDNGRVDGCEE